MKLAERNKTIKKRNKNRKKLTRCLQSPGTKEPKEKNEIKRIKQDKTKKRNKN